MGHPDDRKIVTKRKENDFICLASAIQHYFRNITILNKIWLPERSMG